MKNFDFFKDRFIYLINLTLAIITVFIIRLFKLKYNSNIWVIGGNGGDYYSDNGAELHSYILEKYPKIKVYWIINKDSPDVIKAKENGPILLKHSIKGNIYSLLAKVLICNHSVRGDIMRSRRGGNLFRHSFTVHLGHGVNAFKEKEYYPNFDMVIATSDYEKEIKKTWMNNNEEKIIVTGLPRYDTLFKYKDNKLDEKTIFYMPTWRPWLTEKLNDPSIEENIEFKKTNFYEEINSFLNNTELNRLLKIKGYKLKVFFHQNSHFFIKEINIDEYSSNIEILSNNTNVQEQLLSSSLLITDYSSVAWDYLFLDKPVLFYQFDYDKYKKYNNSYISMPEDLFGPVTRGYKETTELINNFINGNINDDSKKNTQMKNKFIKYNDSQNSERVIQAILDKVSR